MLRTSVSAEKGRACGGDGKRSSARCPCLVVTVDGYSLKADPGEAVLCDFLLAVFVRELYLFFAFEAAPDVKW